MAMEEGQKKEGFKKDFKKDGFKKNRNVKPKDDFNSKTLEIRRVTKVVKGGRTMRFSACAVVGDGKGKVGMGTGKAAEVSVAIEKAIMAAKKNLVQVVIVDGTLPYEAKGKFSTSTVYMWPTKKGNGIIAGGAARAVVELAGYRDITTKIHGSRNKICVASATIKALSALRSKEEVAALRGIDVESI